jgi:hypothetical protein
LIIADVETNTGPSLSLPSVSSVIFGLLNTRSFVNKAAHIHELVADLCLDILALTETWIASDVPDVVKLDVAPPGYKLIYQHRGTSVDKRGGGIAVLNRECLSARCVDIPTTNGFETDTTVSNNHCGYRLSTIRRYYTQFL